MELFQVPNAV